MNITEKMLEVMKQKNIKSSELADVLNINRSVISAWKKRGTNPPAEYLVQICKHLEISINELLGEEPEYSKEEVKIINAYRAADQEHKNAVKTLLSIKSDSQGKLSDLKIG